jgi:hypothetical protein
MMPQSKARSNTLIVFGAFALIFGVFFWAARGQLESRLAESMVLGSFSFPFLGTALSQLRSGYLWRNLSPGNRGLHRSESPARFALSTAGHFLMAAAIIGYAVWNCTRPS